MSAPIQGAPEMPPTPLCVSHSCLDRELIALSRLERRKSAVGNMQNLSLSALNDPAAFGGFTSAATVELPLIAPEGWFGYAAAGRAARAQDAAASRMAGATVFLVTQAYLDAQVAAARLATLDTALMERVFGGR